MKNILSTLVVIVVVACLVVAAFFLYQRFSGFQQGDRKLTAEEAAIEITERLGKPLVNAWSERDVETLKSLIKGEFGAGIASDIQWTIEMQLPFETKRRKCTEEDELSTSDSDVFFGCLLDPTSGLKNLQTEFSILKITDYSNERYKDVWQCRVLLVASGIDANSHLTTFRSEQDVTIKLPKRGSLIPPAFQYWEVRDEIMQHSQTPVMEQIQTLLSNQGIEFSEASDAAIDVADFDGDDDLDIAMTMSHGKRFVFAFVGPAYEDVTESLAITDDEADLDSQDSIRTAWLDFNRDGIPDLISGNRLFENENGSRFVDVTEEVGFRQLVGSSDVNTMGLVRRHVQSQ